MTRKNDEHSTALTAWAESDAPTVRPDAVIYRGPAAAAAGRALLDAAAADDPAAAELLRSVGRGRPALEPEGDGPSPMWKVRAPKSLDVRMRARARAEGRNLSEVLRAAADEYLTRHAS